MVHHLKNSLLLLLCVNALLMSCFVVFGRRKRQLSRESTNAASGTKSFGLDVEFGSGKFDPILLLT